MTKAPLLLLLAMSWGLLNAQTRYLDKVFSAVDVTSNVEYAVNMSILQGLPPVQQSLKLDIYTPAGDTVTNRPVVLIAGTGNFLPLVFNGGPLGQKTDSANVEMCKQFALRGYVAISYEYRLGWNPIGNDDARRSTILQAAYRGIQDTRTAIRFLRKTVAVDGNPYGIDADKIVAGGLGTGGYLSLGSAFLDQPAEINLLKFINLNSTPPLPYVIPQVFGNYEGSDTTYLPTTDTAGNPIFLLMNLPSHIGYSSDFNMAFHLGGALGDSSWIQDGDMPVVSIHSPADSNAPYNLGNVIVPTTGDIVIPDAAGGLLVQSIQNRFGNNQIFVDAGFNDVITQSSNSNLEALYSFNAVAPRADTQCVTSIPGYPISSGDPDSGPWNWYSEASFIGTWDFLGGQPGNPITGMEANCAYLVGNLNDPARSKRFIDTAVQYLAPRMALVLELNTVGIQDYVLRENLRVYPNPAKDVVRMETADGSRPLVSATLFDLTGRQVRQLSNLNNTRAEMQVGDLPHGLYLLEVRATEGRFTQRLLVE